MGFGSLSRDFLTINVFDFFTFSSTFSSGSLSTLAGSSSPSSLSDSYIVIYFLLFYCFFCIKFYPLIFYFPEKVFDILVLLFLKA